MKFYHGWRVVVCTVTRRSTPMNIRAASRCWLQTIQWDIAATFTFSYEHTQTQAISEARRFWKEVDYAIYGNASVRFHKRCERIMILEGDGIGQRFHYHAAIILPRDRYQDPLLFCELLYRKWCKVNRRSARVEFSPCWFSDGWSSYITKQVDRYHCDSIDLHSSHIAASNLLNAAMTAE